MPAFHAGAGGDITVSSGAARGTADGPPGATVSSSDWNEIFIEYLDVPDRLTAFCNLKQIDTQHCLSPVLRTMRAEPRSAIRAAKLACRVHDSACITNQRSSELSTCGTERATCPGVGA